MLGTEIVSRRTLAAVIGLLAMASGCDSKKRWHGVAAGARPRAATTTAAGGGAACGGARAANESTTTAVAPADGAARSASGPTVATADGTARAAGGAVVADGAARPAVGASARAVSVAVDRPAGAARSEHAVFHLVDNRHAAHRFVDGDLVLDGADVGFARYTRFGVPTPRWQLGQEVEGVRAAVADRLAVLEVPLAAEQARGVTFVTARVHGADDQKITLKVNGRKPGKDATVGLVAGWITVAIPVARGYFGAGENQVVIETSGARGKVAFEWLRFGSSIGNRDPRADGMVDGKAEALAAARA